MKIEFWLWAWMVNVICHPSPILMCFISKLRHLFLLITKIVLFAIKIFFNCLIPTEELQVWHKTLSEPPESRLGTWNLITPGYFGVARKQHSSLTTAQASNQETDVDPLPPSDPFTVHQKDSVQNPVLTFRCPASWSPSNRTSYSTLHWLPDWDALIDYRQWFWRMPLCGFGVSFWFHSDFASLAGIAQKGGWVLRFVCCQTVDNFNLSRYHWCSLSSLDSGGFCQASPLWSLYQSVYRGEVLGNSVDVSVRLSVYSSVCQYRLTVPHFG